MSEPFTPCSKYRILEQIGQGQFGRVFCAIHQKNGHLVALKELDQKIPTRKFLRELRFLLSLQHQNVVTCQALEYTQTERYLVMDYCEGGTLRSLMQSEVQLSSFQGLNLIANILAGLEHAHERGIAVPKRVRCDRLLTGKGFRAESVPHSTENRYIIHCDIKPENILLSLDTTGWIARVSDFGIARLSQEIGNVHLNDTGSPAYMAPERFYGKYSPASDLYAVGVLLFELVVGDRPFSGLLGELMYAHLNQPVNIPNTIPFLLRSIISTALQKLPARRFADATEMLKLVRQATEVERLTQGSTSPLSIPTLVSSPLTSTQL